jgi:hypothetical protein
MVAIANFHLRKHFRTIFERLKERNLTLNKAKCEFNKDKLEFYGYIFSANGLSADLKKISAIRNTQIPTDVGEVRSVLAMTNYVTINIVSLFGSKYDKTRSATSSFFNLSNDC